MSKLKKTEPFTAEGRPAPIEAEPLNEDILKGVMVDGLGLGLAEHFVLLDGYITPPRSKKDLIVARIIMPPEALPALLKGIESAMEFYRKEFKKELKK